MSADRAAAAIRRGIEREEAVISFPAAPAIALRGLRLVPTWLREWPARVLDRAAEDADATADDVPVPRENLQGD
jgi:hypothetical protein